MYALDIKSMNSLKKIASTPTETDKHMKSFTIAMEPKWNQA
jgi:hypothetical protein